MNSVIYDNGYLERNYRFACINLALLAITLMNPYFKWLLPNGTFQILFIVSTTLSLHFLRGNGLLIQLGRYEQRIVILLILFAIFFCLPIFHKFQGGWLLNVIIFFEILFYDKLIFAGCYKYIRSFFFIICISSLIIWLIHLTGIELPHYTYHPDFRYSSNDYYRIYGFSVSLSDIRSGWLYGVGIERVCGIFAEPGHFGIYLGLLLSFRRFKFENKTDWLFLITGIITFSTAFYGILITGIIYRLWATNDNNKKDIKKIIIAGILFLLLVLFNSNIYNSVLGRVLNYSGGLNPVELVESRATDQSVSTFNTFLTSDNILTGVDSDNINDAIQVTNWRGGIYRYGFIGISLIALLVLAITSDCDMKFRLCLITIAAIIIAHRIYLIYSLGIIIVLYIISNYDPINTSEYWEYDDENEYKDGSGH